MESLNFFETQTNSFKNKNIIITGATGGIGKKVTETLFKLGANIIAVSRTEKKVVDTFPSLVRSNNFKYEIINFQDPTKINKGFVEMIKKFEGKLDGLILCHGIFKAGKLFDTNLEEFDTTVNINVRSCFHFVSIATPFLKLTKGNIVILSSLEAKIPFNDSFINSVSKVS